MMMKRVRGRGRGRGHGGDGDGFWVDDLIQSVKELLLEQNWLPQRQHLWLRSKTAKTSLKWEKGVGRLSSTFRKGVLAVVLFSFPPELGGAKVRQATQQQPTNNISCCFPWS